MKKYHDHNFGLAPIGKNVVWKPLEVATDSTIKQLVEESIKEYGETTDLNHIDISNVTNLDSLFDNSNFNGDISQWDVRKVRSMNYTFRNSKFNKDISTWGRLIVKTKKLTSMKECFCNSDFNQDITSWGLWWIMPPNRDFCFFGSVIDDKFKPDFRENRERWKLRLG